MAEKVKIDPINPANWDIRILTISLIQLRGIKTIIAENERIVN